MKNKIVFILVVLSSIFINNEAFAVSWQKKQASLMTPWSEHIDTMNVWSEYPRPQMVRSEWQNLNGVWDFEKGDEFGTFNSNQTFSKRILVPFPIESALSGVMDTDYVANMTKTFFYRTFFTLPKKYVGKKMLLHFGAVDWACAVFVNGIQVGMHKGGYDPFSFDITSALIEGGKQELQVQVSDPSDRGAQPKGKQVAYPGGIYYTPVSGIWQTVWLEPVENTYISDFTLTPDLDKQSVIVNLKVANASATSKATIKLYDKEQLISTLTNVEIGKDAIIKISNPKLWSPDSPFLYDIEFEIADQDRLTDQVKSYFGMRKIGRGAINGIPCLLLNNKPIFHFGILDQGYWPDGLYTAPSDEAMMFDLVKTKELGMNMTRKHIKVEPARWYYHCDRLGLMVWQDIPSALEGGTIGDKSFVQTNFYREMNNIILSLKNCPSIVSWDLFNEGWGQDAAKVDVHTRKAFDIAQRLDTTRLINAVSGWVDFEFGDMIDRHSYPHPGLHTNPLKERVAVCGEYGGITLQVKDHLWKGNGQQYVSASSSEELKTLFINYVKEIQGLQQSGIWGAVYTQVTDVEEENNGLITYDRKVVKVDSSQVAQIRESVKKTIEMRSVSLLDAGDVSENAQWKFVTANPGSGWYAENFDDRFWEVGIAGFGAGGPPNSFIRTKWSSNEIYLRRTFNLKGVSETDIPSIKLWVYYDEGCDIFINGVLAAQTTGYVSNFKMLDISEAALKALRTDGENLIAVKCTQSWGGQCIDVGLTIQKGTSELFSEPKFTKPIEPIKTEEDSVYLMSFFKGDAQHLFYAYSKDGLAWKDINYSGPVFDAFNESIWLRDPFMKRVTSQGKTKFHLVHTWGWDNPAIFHWESTDLIHWNAANGGITNEDGKVFVMDGKNGNAIAPNAWAPEFTYDPVSETFYLYWSSNISGGYQKHYYCKTKDWLTFTPSAPFFDPGFTAIDLTILEYNGTYFGFYKDERGGQKKIRLATSKSLDPKVQEFRGIKEVLTGGYSVEVEGPEVFKAIGQKKWFLYWDKFIGDQGVSYASNVDPASEKWYMEPDSLVKNPMQVKHGSVEIISKAELDVLLNHFNKERQNVLLTADIEPQEWKYTTEMPYPGWYTSSFNDSKWKTGIGGFGSGDVGQGVIRTPWTGAEIYLRKKFHVGTLTEYELNNLFLNICYDDDATVYINGIKAMVIEGHSMVYVAKGLSDAVKKSIVQNGENIIAIKCIEKGGVQYIDAGLQTYSLPTSIPVLNQQKQKMVYYNTTDQILMISTNALSKDSCLQVFDLNGKLVYSGLGREQTNLESLGHGMFFAVVSDKNKCSTVTATFIR